MLGGTKISGLFCWPLRNVPSIFVIKQLTAVATLSDVFKLIGDENVAGGFDDRNLIIVSISFVVIEDFCNVTIMKSEFDMAVNPV